MQRQISADELLNYAQTLKGQKLLTLDKSKPFSVEVKEDVLVYTPLSSKKDQHFRHQKEYLRRICEEFSATHSLNPKTYAVKKPNQKSSICGSYTLPLIIKYLAFIVDGGR